MYWRAATTPGQAMDDSVLGLSSRNGGQAVSDFCYVYILDSLSHPGCHYTGPTDNLQARLAKHNDGVVSKLPNISPGKSASPSPSAVMDKAADSRQERWRVAADG